jgi:predicted HTH transcriptional regulator
MPSGKEPFNGTHATLEQVMPLVNYIKNIIEQKLIAVLQLVRGEIKDLIETKEEDVMSERNVGEMSEKNVGEKLSERQEMMLFYIKQNDIISAKELAKFLQITDRTIEREIQKLKRTGVLERIGGDRGGYWKINRQ